MLLVYSPCNFTQVAVREIFKELTADGDTDYLLVMDSRAFSSITEMHDAAIKFSQIMVNAKILIISNDRFISGRHEYGTLPYCVQLKADLDSFKESLCQVMTKKECLEISLHCLSTYSGRTGVSYKDKKIISLLKKELTVKQISKVIVIKEKTLYSYLNMKKKLYRQHRLVDLIRFFENWRV